MESCCLTSIGIPIKKIGQSHDCFTFIMGIPLCGKTVFILKSLCVCYFRRRRATLVSMAWHTSTWHRYSTLEVRHKSRCWLIDFEEDNNVFEYIYIIPLHWNGTGRHASPWKTSTLYLYGIHVPILQEHTFISRKWLLLPTHRTSAFKISTQQIKYLTCIVSVSWVLVSCEASMGTVMTWFEWDILLSANGELTHGSL